MSTLRSRLRQRSSSFKHKRQTKDDYVQVTNFLLGGSLNDPLNLSSIDPNEQNQKTPVCSPMPYQSKEVEILIPCDISDPLKLNNDEIKESSELCHLLISPHKPRIMNSKRKRTESDSIVSELMKDERLEKRIKFDLKDKIVSPVIVSQQQSDRYHHNNNKRNSTNVNSQPFHHHSQDLSQSNSNKHQDKRPFNFKANQNQSFYYAKNQNSKGSRKFNAQKDQKFQFGNYNRYYGYRNQNQNQDLRLTAFKKEWFEGKTVLDIGCNVGYVTCSIARDFKPLKIVGVDIDQQLINAAKRNVRHYLNSKPDSDSGNHHGPLTNKDDVNHKANENKSNMSNENVVNKVDSDKLKQKEDDNLKVDLNDEQLSVKDDTTNQLNIQFIAANYVLPNDQLLSTQQAEYDCILCLSLTKWVHLNFGDQALKRMFKRIYLQLNNNGMLILEPQPIWSYKRKKALTETTLKNYNSIKFKPDQFKDYLLSSEVGFKSCETIDPPNHTSKGFQRPIYIFHK